MERVALDVEEFHLGLLDPEALLVAPLVECAFDFQACLGRGAADQLDHGRTAFERLAAPVLRDVAEQPMFDAGSSPGQALFHFDVPGG